MWLLGVRIIEIQFVWHLRSPRSSGLSVIKRCSPHAVVCVHVTRDLCTILLFPRRSPPHLFRHLFNRKWHGFFVSGKSSIADRCFRRHRFSRLRSVFFIICFGVKSVTFENEFRMCKDFEQD